MCPGLQYTIAKWSPPQEKGRFVFATIGIWFLSCTCWWCRIIYYIAFQSFCRWNAWHRAHVAICGLLDDKIRMGVHILYPRNNCIGSHVSMDYNRLQFANWTSADHRTGTEIHWGCPRQFRVTYTGRKFTFESVGNSILMIFFHNFVSFAFHREDCHRSHAF